MKKKSASFESINNVYEQQKDNQVKSKGLSVAGMFQINYIKNYF